MCIYTYTNRLKELCFLFNFMAIVDFECCVVIERERSDWGSIYVGVWPQPLELKTHVFTKQLIFFGKKRKNKKGSKINGKMKKIPKHNSNKRHSQMH